MESMVQHRDPSKRDKYVLEFEAPGDRARMKARAALNGRTMNAELLYLISRGEAAVALENGRTSSGFDLESAWHNLAKM